MLPSLHALIYARRCNQLHFVCGGLCHTIFNIHKGDRVMTQCDPFEEIAGHSFSKLQLVASECSCQQLPIRYCTGMNGDKSETELMALDLLEAVNYLDAPTDRTAPLTSALEKRLNVGPGRGRATYCDQKHHWTRWLNDYQRPDRPAQRVYNAINCPTMLFWLAEAIGVDRERLVLATHAAEAAPKNQVSQTAAIRSLISWSLIHHRLVVIDVSG